ncbi:carbohydrate ABC transporter permease [Phytoactinopolyspora alkaliphila]|uniref:carbohydrate ABC transporter permease n=1 Tax=Phytoactinopolyspora alkaliphila TaxID=1783498 RepID=UPI001C20A6C1
MRRPLTRRPLTRSRRDDLTGRLLVSPTVLVVFLVVVLPFFAVVAFGFLNVRLVDIPRISLFDLEFTVDNFSTVLSSTVFWTSFRTTAIYATATTLGAIAAGLAVAIALRHPFPGRGLIRALVLIPYVLPIVAATTIWKTLLNSQYGVVNAFGTEFLGWDGPIAFLSTTSQTFLGIPVPVTLVVVVLFEIWKTAPLAFLFITARLQVIPGELEEAASIDGASITQRFRYIVMPQLRGVVALLILLRFIWSFQSFNDIYLLTGGAGGTQVMAIKVYDELITRANIGTAAAYGLVMTVILAVLMAVYVRANRAENIG